MAKRVHPRRHRRIAETLVVLSQEDGAAILEFVISAAGGRPSDTVTMTADVDLDVDLLRLVGLSPVLKLEATHQERRLVE